MLGKRASDLQANILVSDDKIAGTLKYVEGYNGFSDIPDEQSGNYLAFIAKPKSIFSKISAELNNGKNFVLNGSGKELKGYFLNFDSIGSDGYAQKKVLTNPDNGYTTVSLKNGFVNDGSYYKVGKEIVYSYDILYRKFDIPEGATVKEWHMGQRYNDAEHTRVTYHRLPQPGDPNFVLNKWIHIEQVMTIPEKPEEGSTTSSMILLGVQDKSHNVEIDFSLRNVKLEYGNKATGEGNGIVKLISDNLFVAKIVNKDSQTITVESTIGDEKESKTYKLEDLTIQTK